MPLHRTAVLRKDRRQKWWWWHIAHIAEHIADDDNDNDNDDISSKRDADANSAPSWIRATPKPRHLSDISHVQQWPLFGYS